MNFALRLLITLTVFSSLAGCNQTTTQSNTVVSELPVSINELMVALVNQAADPIWEAAWRNPTTDKDWRNLEYLSYQLEVAGPLLTIPGDGPLDKQWVSTPKWSEYATRLGMAGKQAREAVKLRDLDALEKAGDAIVEACEACHIEYKLALPTGGIFGEL